MTQEGTVPTRSITKSVAIDRSPDAVFSFIADPANWPRWAIVNVQSTNRSAEPGWWDMETPRGSGRLRIHAEPRFGILDHEFVNDEAYWAVPARVVPNGRGAEFMMTLRQPPGMSDAVFESQVALIGDEYAMLKRILEAEKDGTDA